MNVMNIIKTQPHHIESVCNLYKQAALFLRDQGIDQWQNHYPNFESLQLDIQKKGSYVLVNEKDEVCATFALLFEDDPYYEIIEEGSWSFDSPYGVVHRLCVNPTMKHQGLASQCLMFAVDECEKNKMNGCRIDTHPDNKKMQGLILKCGFEYCGLVHVANHALRWGYERKCV